MQLNSHFNRNRSRMTLSVNENRVNELNNVYFEVDTFILWDLSYAAKQLVINRKEEHKD